MYWLTITGVCVLFVTPDEIIQQTPVGMDQFSPLILSRWLFAIPPTLSNRQLTLCILDLTMEQQVKWMFQADLEVQREQLWTMLQQWSKINMKIVQWALLADIPAGNVSLLNVSFVRRCCCNLPSLSWGDDGGFQWPFSTKARVEIAKSVNISKKYCENICNLYSFFWLD